MVWQEVLAEVKIMELITNWKALKAVSLAFCQFQGMAGIIVITGILIFRHNLGELLSIFK
jgi:hypothetical protein